MIDYSEMLTENQLQKIIKYIFNNLKEIISEAIPINQNCESILINANINTVFYFWANWRTRFIEKEIVREIKFNGDPKIPGSSLELTYLNKYRINIIVNECISYEQKDEKEDDTEWNYKFTIVEKEGQSECFNTIFISCENGTKTLVIAENDINKNMAFEKIQELSKRKLGILNEIKNYIEKTKEDLKKLGNDVY